MSTPGAIEPERVAKPAAGRRLPSLLYLDRYRNEGTRDYSPHAAYSEAREEYRPDTGEAVFHLPVYELPRGEMQVHAANPPPELEAAYLPEDAVLFCIHPQVLSQCPDDPYVQRTHRLSTARSQVHASRQHLRVSPTSSTRTLLVAQEVGPTHFCPHSLKVHFPFRISRYGRRMRDEVVEQAIAVSEELERWLEVERRREIERLPGIEESGKPGFAFLREVIGITHRNLSPDSARGENWGYLVRDMVPFPVVDEARDLVPGFALYGRDLFDPQLSPLILELADPGDAAGWTLENVLLPIVRHWVRCFQDLGFVLEPHGQNVLLEIDQNGRATRIVHRDLSVAIDMRRRRDLGLPDGGLNGYNRMESGAFNSIAYDRFMGGHFFDSLLGPLLQRDPASSLEDFRHPVREEFDRIFPDHERYLPRTVHYFSEARDRFGKPMYQDTGLAPHWRP
jgi:hypothetical protein